MDMSLPLYDNGILPALLLGLLFGLVLEGAGFGSARKLTAQFTLRDFTVFKVMFTAVIVAAVGLWLAEVAGLMAARSVYIPTLFWWSIALGGALIGAGFALGGYCPGTSAVAVASGRLDALVFVAGMVIGVAVFAILFEPLLPFYQAAQAPKGQTLDQLTGLPVPLILAVLAAMAVAGFWLGGRLERRFGGPLSAMEVAGGKAPDRPAGPRDVESPLGFTKGH
jgi:hypothetical protein